MLERGVSLANAKLNRSRSIPTRVPHWIQKAGYEQSQTRSETPKSRLNSRRPEPARRQEPSNKSCSPAPTSARPSIPSNPRARASVQCWPDSCGDYKFPPLPPDGHCAPAPSQSPQDGSAVVCAHLRAPVESLTRDVYPCIRKSPARSRQTIIMQELRRKGKHAKPNHRPTKMSS